MAEMSSTAAKRGGATYGRIEYLHPAGSFITEPLSDANNVLAFGRDPKCDIVLESPHIASVQTKIYVEHNELWVCDTGRASGEPSLTRVNQMELSAPHRLQPEDIIEIFNRRFRYVADHIKREKENDPLGLKPCSLPSKAVNETPQLSAKANPVMVEEEPMNYIAERIKSVFGEEFYDRSFEQWCDNKHHGKAYSTVSGPRRDNYDWVPGPDLASIAPLMVENTHTGVVDLYLPLGSFVPKQQQKAKRLARRTVRSGDFSSSKAACDAPASSNSNEKEAEKVTPAVHDSKPSIKSTNNRKKRIVVEEEREEDVEEDKSEEDEEQTKKSTQKGRRVALVRGISRSVTKKQQESSQDDDIDNYDEDAEEEDDTKPSSQSRKGTAKKVPAIAAKKKTMTTKKKTATVKRTQAKEDFDLSDEFDDGEFDFLDSDQEVVAKTTKKVARKTASSATKAKKTTTKQTTKRTQAKEDEDSEELDEADFNSNVDDELGFLDSDQEAVPKTAKRVARKAASTATKAKKATTTKKATTKTKTGPKTKATKTKGRDDHGDDDDGDYDADAIDSDVDLDITGINEENDDERIEEVAAKKQKATKKKPAQKKPPAKKAPPPADSSVRRSGRSTRSAVDSSAAKSSGAALFRATKQVGGLVDPFSPNKSIQKNFKQEYHKRKTEKSNSRGVVTRRRANANDDGDENDDEDNAESNTADEPVTPEPVAEAPQKKTRGQGKRLDL